MKKAAPYIIIVIIAIALIVIKNYKKNDNNRIEHNDPATGINRNQGFDRRISFIEYTQHAKCRMPCRHISQSEVEQIMQEGKINYHKSEAKGRPCPTYALEGVTNDNQRVRIVYAQCDLKTKVVTVIDLDTEWECHCPGDAAK